MQHKGTCSRHPNASRSQQDGYLTAREQGMAQRIPGFDDSRLRALRLWHWRQVKRYGIPEHDFHLQAVQALNDCFDIDDTAEKDAQRQTP